MTIMTTNSNTKKAGRPKKVVEETFEEIQGPTAEELAETAIDSQLENLLPHAEGAEAYADIAPSVLDAGVAEAGVYADDKADNSLSEAVSLLKQQLADLQGQVAAQRKVPTRGGGGQALDLADNHVGGFPWAYYKRVRGAGGLMNGWISVAPGGGSGARRAGEQFSHYIAKGFQPVEGYGNPDPPTSERGWEMFFPILARGGAKEFPASQVLAYKWNIKPPIRGLKFPQLEAIPDEEILHAECEECDFEMFAVPEDHDISRAFFGHLHKYHQWTRREAIRLISEQKLPQIGRFAVDET